MEIIGKTAIITGASGELGSEIALCLGRRGMHCLCHYHTSKGKAAKDAASIRKLGPKAEVFGADLCDPVSAELLLQQAQDLGPVRVVVNSASIFAKQPIGKLDEADVSKLLAVNLAAPMRICDEFAIYLEREGLGYQEKQKTIAAIINLVDVAGVKPWGEYSPYCASRAGLIGMTKSLAKEMAPAVTVNAIAPGIVTWPGKMDTDEEQKQLQMIPTGRFGTPNDVTRTIEFLLDNDYITGQVLCVDGGRSI